MAKVTDIVVPDLGDFSDVEIIEVLVSKGDRVEREDGLITLETDKATMDVPASEAGVIEEISVSVGDTVSSGSVIGKLSVGDDDTASVADGGDASGDTGGAAPADSGAAKTGGKAAAAGGKQTLRVPDIGDFEDVDIIEVHVSAGESVEVEDPLVTLETDKATMDVPAETAGTVRDVLVTVGDKVSKGSELVVIDAVATADDASAPEPDKAAREPEKRAPAEKPAAVEAHAAPRQAAGQPARKDPGLPVIHEAGFARAHASPSVRKLARELGVDLTRVTGNGAKGRILHADVKAFVKSAMTGTAESAGAPALPATPVVDFTKFGDVEEQPLTRIQKISGPRLQASWINLPHVTQHDQADITELEERRQQLKGPAKERGIPLTPLAFILKACIAALKEFPTVNASLSADGKSLVVKKYYHLGFAADTEQGLMVPVIRNADQKDVYELANELKNLSAAARDGKLKADDLQGATFTVSSLGGIGGTAFTPIVNAPEVAILGVSRSSMQPVWDGEKFEPRLMLPLSLSYDHRVIDGALAVRFTTFLGEALGDVDTLLQAIP